MPKRRRGPIPGNKFRVEREPAYPFIHAGKELVEEVVEEPVTVPKVRRATRARVVRGRVVKRRASRNFKRTIVAQLKRLNKQSTAKTKQIRKDLKSLGVRVSLRRL